MTKKKNVKIIINLLQQQQKKNKKTKQNKTKTNKLTNKYTDEHD